jgi:hypothetical protein
MAVPASGFAPLTVQFTPVSPGADAYFWRFGDGGTSPAHEPRHTYKKPGTYTVSLEARDSCTGAANRTEKTGYIMVTTSAGTLDISSDPAGAMVFIDNIVKGITPVTLTDTAIGNHLLILRKEGYDDYTRNLIIDPTTPASFGATLTKSAPEPTPLPTSFPGSIAITSYPSGAAVFLDGRLAGSAPVIVSDVVAGVHEITLSLRGYENRSHIVSVGSGQAAAVNAGLVALPEITGALAVITDPPGAEIYIDGTFRGVSPVTLTGISPGTHSVLLTLQEYADNSANISITAGQTWKYSVGLRKVYRPSALDILLSAGIIMAIGIIALVVMFKKDSKKKK